MFMSALRPGKDEYILSAEQKMELDTYTCVSHAFLTILS